LSAVQQQSDYETKLVVDNLDVTYLEVRVWNISTGGTLGAYASIDWEEVSR